MTITVIARDATGKKSTWHWDHPGVPTVDDDLVEMVRTEVAEEIKKDGTTFAGAVLALVPK